MIVFENPYISAISTIINMQFDINNEVVKRCAEGMLREGQGNGTGARALFNEAWHLATTDFEKFTAAHYSARHQDSVEEKLAWDKQALAHALKLDSDDTKDVLPSLYLNIGKCYEDLNEHTQALENYQAGLAFDKSDSGDGYANMIRSGLNAGLARVLANGDQ